MIRALTILLIVIGASVMVPQACDFSTPAVHDTIVQVDTLFIHDTIVQVDTVTKISYVFVVDTVYLPNYGLPVFLSVNGDDSARGTYGEPWETLKYALIATPENGVINFKDGQLVFTRNDSVEFIGWNKR